MGNKMKTIHKFQVSVGTNYFTLPEDSYILSAGLQGHYMYIWAYLDTDGKGKEASKVTVTIVGTGWDLDGCGINEDFIFINSIIEGEYVWHVYAKY